MYATQIQNYIRLTDVELENLMNYEVPLMDLLRRGPYVLLVLHY